MTWERPESKDLWRAIDLYLRVAYDGTARPAAVEKRLRTLREGSELYRSEVLEHEASAEPERYALRLGSRVYPHMKLVIERAPDGRSYLFRADTHDRHCRPATDSKEYPAYCQLVEQNQKIAQHIEGAWAAVGLPTFKTFLKADLARRTTGASAWPERA